jgi:hypothetical protein
MTEAQPTLPKVRSKEMTFFFVENITFQDTKLRIEYTGKVSGDEINHPKSGGLRHRRVVAKRV